MEKTKIQTRKIRSQEDLDSLTAKDLVRVKGMGVLMYGCTDEQTGELFFVGKGKNGSVGHVSVPRDAIKIGESERSLPSFAEQYKMTHIANQKALFYKSWNQALEEAGVLN